MKKLYMRTSCGTTLGIDVLLTSRVKEEGGKIRSVQIYMPTGGHVVVENRIQPQPQGRGSTEVLWVDPSDLCDVDGSWLGEAELRAEVVRVEESLRYEDMYGPLGKDWP